MDAPGQVGYHRPAWGHAAFNLGMGYSPPHARHPLDDWDPRPIPVGPATPVSEPWLHPLPGPYDPIPVGPGAQPYDPVYGGEDGWTAWEPVNSSNVDLIRYHAARRVLQIKFIQKPGSKHHWYEYDGVGEDIWRAFLAAPSKGVFVWSYVRGRGARNGEPLYPYRPLG